MLNFEVENPSPDCSGILLQGRVPTRSQMVRRPKQQKIQRKAGSRLLKIHHKIKHKYYFIKIDLDLIGGKK
jgi:hypothetical protein